MTATFNSYHIRGPTEGKKICGGKGDLKSPILFSMYNVIQVGRKYFFVHFDENRTILKNVPSKISPPLK